MEALLALLAAFIAVVLFNFLFWIPAQLLADKGLKKTFPKDYLGLNGKTGEEEAKAASEIKSEK